MDHHPQRHPVDAHFCPPAGGAWGVDGLPDRSDSNCISTSALARGNCRKMARTSGRANRIAPRDIPAGDVSAAPAIAPTYGDTPDSLAPIAPAAAPTAGRTIA